MPREPRQLSLLKNERQRGTLPPPPLEFELQCVLADMIDTGLAPGWRWTHFPAGELRNKVTANRLKRMGTKPGWADIQLFAPNAGGAHFIELKRTGQLYATSYAQDEFACWCNDNGYRHAIVDTVKAAIAVLRHWRAVRITV